MWLLQSIFELLFIFFGFMYFKQITTLTLYSFRQGIIIYKYREPFSGEIPKELIKQEIRYNDIIFKFNSSNQGIFRTHPNMSYVRDFRRSYFPSVLGEINLTDNGVAEITLRTPLSLILIWLVILTALVVSNIESVFSINSVGAIVKGVFVMLIIGVIVYIFFDFEKTDLRNGIKILSEHAKNNTL
jgi:hypothetical protein